MPPVKVYRISVAVGADSKKKKISYANEYDFDVTLRIIVDSEYMTVRQDHVVIPKVPINFHHVMVVLHKSASNVYQSNIRSTTTERQSWYYRQDCADAVAEEGNCFFDT